MREAIYCPLSNPPPPPPLLSHQAGLVAEMNDLAKKFMSSDEAEARGEILSEATTIAENHEDQE